MNPSDINILIACEESQTVCKAFRERGFNAFSCDIQDCSGGHPEWHIKEDVLKVINSHSWDLMIGHPPCTYLSYAATHCWDAPGRLEKRLSALKFFAALWLSPIEYICLENPKGCASPTIAKYTQEIQPYYFGDEHMKTTWLWLKNLPKLIHNETSNLFETKTHAAKPEPIFISESGKKLFFSEATGGYHGEGNSCLKRSKTFPGIAEAMAEQWGNYLLNL
jgi:hypothetical protein